jgi:tripartite-type tricarboxylate transporter receptor subunit TctC
VPYPGDAPMLIDLVSGRVQAAVDAVPASLPHIRAKEIRPLAILSRHRDAALPDLPTAAETIAGFDVTPWTGVGVPTGTPHAVIERLNREINAGLADPGIKAQLAQIGGVPIVYTPDEMRTMIASDTAKWASVIKQAGIEPQ